MTIRPELGPTVTEGPPMIDPKLVAMFGREQQPVAAAGDGAGWGVAHEPVVVQTEAQVVMPFDPERATDGVHEVIGGSVAPASMSVATETRATGAEVADVDDMDSDSHETFGHEWYAGTSTETEPTVASPVFSASPPATVVEHETTQEATDGYAPEDRWTDEVEKYEAPEATVANDEFSAAYTEAAVDAEAQVWVPEDVNADVTLEGLHERLHGERDEPTPADGSEQTESAPEVADEQPATGTAMTVSDQGVTLSPKILEEAIKKQKRKDAWDARKAQAAEVARETARQSAEAVRITARRVGAYVLSWTSANMAYAHQGEKEVKPLIVTKPDTIGLTRAETVHVTTEYVTARVSAGSKHLAQKNTKAARTVSRAMYLPASGAAFAAGLYGAAEAIDSSVAETPAQKIAILSLLAFGPALGKFKTLVSQERDNIKARTEAEA
jgi:hypothetical protein